MKPGVKLIVPKAPEPPIVSLEFPVFKEPEPVMVPLRVRVNKALFVIARFAPLRFRIPFTTGLPAEFLSAAPEMVRL